MDQLADVAQDLRLLRGEIFGDTDDDTDGGGSTPSPPVLPTGGTAGQFLQKASATDYDSAWADVPSLVFEVDDYDAVGDGTVDDTVAIQAAVDACGAAGGGVVWFTPGKRYAHSSTIHLDTVHVVLASATAFSSYLKPITGGDLSMGQVWISANDCGVHDLGFQPGSATYTSNPVADAIHVECIAGGTAVARTRVENCSAFYINGWFYNAQPLSKVITAATSQIAGNTITSASHGFTNGTAVVVAGLTVTTGISNGVTYYVVGTATNTFQLALTVGGAAIDLTGADDTGLTVRSRLGLQANVPPDIQFIARCDCRDGAGGIRIQGGGSTRSVGAQLEGNYIQSNDRPCYEFWDTHDVMSIGCSGGMTGPDVEDNQATLRIHGDCAAMYFSSNEYGAQRSTGSHALRIEDGTGDDALYGDGDAPFNLNFGQCIFEFAEDSALVSAGDGINFVNCNFTLAKRTGLVISGSSVVSVLACGFNDNNFQNIATPGSTGFDLDVTSVSTGQVQATLCKFSSTEVSAATRQLAGNVVRQTLCANNTGQALYDTTTGVKPKHIQMPTPDFTGSYVFDPLDLPPDLFTGSITTTPYTPERGTSGINATGGAKVVTLPDAASIPGQEFVIFKTDVSANTVTITPLSPDTINGSTASLVLNSQFEFTVLMSNGTNWFVKGGSGSASRLQHFPTVYDFGAVGDGVTDDTAALQAALDSDQLVFVPAGKFRTTATLVIDPDLNRGSGLVGLSAASHYPYTTQTGGPTWDGLQEPVIFYDGSTSTTAAVIAASAEAVGVEPAATFNDSLWTVIIRDVVLDANSKAGFAFYGARVQNLQLHHIRARGATVAGVSINGTYSGSAIGVRCERNLGRGFELGDADTRWGWTAQDNVNAFYIYDLHCSANGSVPASPPAADDLTFLSDNCGFFFGPHRSVHVFGVVSELSYGANIVFAPSDTMNSLQGVYTELGCKFDQGGVGTDAIDLGYATEQWGIIFVGETGGTSWGNRIADVGCFSDHIWLTGTSPSTGRPESAFELYNVRASGLTADWANYRLVNCPSDMTVTGTAATGSFTVDAGISVTGPIVETAGDEVPTSGGIQDKTYGGQSNLILTRVGGSLASPTAVLLNETIGSIGFWGARDTTPNFNSGGFISAVATQNWASGSAGHDMRFYTVPSSTTTRTVALILGQDQSAHFYDDVTVDGSLHGVGGAEVQTEAGVTNTTFAASSVFYAQRINDTAASPDPLLINEVIGGFGVKGQRTTTVGQVTGTALMQAVATQNWASTAAGSRWDFYTTKNNEVTRTIALVLGQDQSAHFYGAMQIDGSTTAAAVTATSLALAGNGVQTKLDGWVADTNTWVYASATTFTIAGVDATGWLPKGTKVSYNDGAVDYGVVAAVSFSTDTTVTLIANDDYSIANATLTAPRYSYAAAPQSFPQFFNYTPTLSGWSANPTNAVYRYRCLGTSIQVTLRQATAGTSNNATHTITVPVTAATITNMSWGVVTRCNDNGIVTAGLVSIGSAGTFLTCSGLLATNNNTASGNSAVAYAQIWYEF